MNTRHPKTAHKVRATKKQDGYIYRLSPPMETQEQELIEYVIYKYVDADSAYGLLHFPAMSSLIGAEQTKTGFNRKGTKFALYVENKKLTAEKMLNQIGYIMDTSGVTK